LSRKIFIDYLGIELLGLSSTFTSILNTLSLAELGFQSAIVYSLYKPINRKDEREINEILNIFKIIYRILAVFIFLASIVCSFFIPKVIKGIKIELYIYIIFYIQVLTSVASYCFAYKRTLLFADKREYISKTIDLIITAIFTALQIVTIIKTKNYYFYLVLNLIRVITSNIFVHLYCSKIYKYLCSEEINKNRLSIIFSYVKDIFIGRIAGYIYSSTDYLVISAMINTKTVGFYANYIIVIQSLKQILESLLKPLIPLIGAEINKKDFSDKQERLFLQYTYVRYFMACLIVIPTFILIDLFITIWVGDEYILQKSIIILLSAEFYIYLVHGGTKTFIHGKGLFKVEKKVEIIAAIINLGSSVILAYFIGLPGVLMGTVLAQLFYWISRSYIVYKYIFINDSGNYKRYWLKSLKQLIVFIFELVLTYSICSIISFNSRLVSFIVKGCLSEVIIVLFTFLSYYKSDEQKVLISAFIKWFNCHKT
jgi:O-antigen/teichoic acid export membrane protein